MKLTIRPDVHGRPFWRDAVKDVSYTPVVFLGDYLDPYPQDMITWENALQGLHDIIELKKKHPEQVTVLLGNHDVHYFESYPFFSRGGRMNLKRFEEIQGIFMENLDLFEKACEQAEAETSKALSTGMILRYENRDAFFFPLALLSDNDKISRWIVEDYESYLKGEHRYL